jgi:hypothetical protein
MGMCTISSRVPDFLAAMCLCRRKVLILRVSRCIIFNRALEHVKTESHGRKARVELNVNRSNKAVSFYRHLGMTVLRQGDFHIGNGFYMNDYIMGLDL